MERREEIDKSSIKIIHTVDGYDPGSAYYDFLVRARKESFDYLIERVFGGWDEDQQREILNDETKGRHPDIIFYNNEPIGSYCLTKGEDCIYFENFFILPKYQQKGIGAFALEKALETADREQLPVRLIYWNFNPARSLYRKMGFETTGRREFEGTKDYWVIAERKPKAASKSGRKFEAIIFDLGGTLISGPSWSDYANAAREMAALLSAPVEDFARLWFEGADGLGPGIIDYQGLIRHVCNQLGVPVRDNQIDTAASIPFNVTKQKMMLPRDGAIEILAYLKSNDYKTGLISDCATDTPIIWPETPFAPFFDVTIFSCSVGMIKTDPRIFQIAVKELAVKPERCLYIADGMRQELASAKKLGMDALQIRAPDEITDSPIREDWDGPVISSLKEVLNLLGE